MICDVEGFEEELLVPERFAALAGFDVLAELPPFTRPDMTELRAEDRALAVWETRGTPTPWAVMTARAMDRP